MSNIWGTLRTPLLAALLCALALATPALAQSNCGPMAPCGGSPLVLGLGVAPLLAGTASGTGGPLGSVSPTVTGTLTLNGAITGSNTGVYTDTQANLYNQFLLGGVNPATEFSGQQSGLHQTEALTAGILVPAGATVHGANAFGAYVADYSGGTYVTSGGSVAGYFQNVLYSPNENGFSLNPLCAIAGGAKNSRCQSEFDYNVSDTGAGVGGLNLVLSGTSGNQPTLATGFAVEVSAQSAAYWGYAFTSTDGAAQWGMNLRANATAGAPNFPGSTSTLVNLEGRYSQAALFTGIDGSDNTWTSEIYGTSTGGLVLRGGQNGQPITLQDYGSNSGTTIATFATSGIGLLDTVTAPQVIVSGGSNIPLSIWTEFSVLVLTGGINGISFVNMAGNSDTFSVSNTGVATFYGLAGTGSRPVCVTSTGILEAGSLSSGLTTCP